MDSIYSLCKNVCILLKRDGLIELLENDFTMARGKIAVSKRIPDATS